MHQMTCLFLNPEEKKCQASGEFCSLGAVDFMLALERALGPRSPNDDVNCLERCPGGVDPIITRGEVEEALELCHECDRIVSLRRA